MKQYKAAESVTKGHPDKLCDQIADAILDEHLSQDKNARVAVEVLATKGLIVIAGEITSKAKVNTAAISRRVLRDTGYDPLPFRIKVKLHEQSPDIAQGVNLAFDFQGVLPTQLGAGDQSIVYGYAVNETPELLPLAQVLARKLTQALESAREDNLIDGLCPDGKALVVLEYENGEAKRVQTVVVSAQHEPGIDLELFRDAIKRYVIDQTLSGVIDYTDAEIYINPTGSFVKGGPAADTGLTGRKLAVDTYCGLAKHGGGAFSGKDATKVDRSGAYMARLIAQSVVLADFADECEVCIGYAIGKSEPLFYDVDCFGTESIPLDEIKDRIEPIFPMEVSAMIDYLRLNSGGYRQLAAQGHFGNSSQPWESAFGGLLLRIGGNRHDYNRTIENSGY